MKLLAAFLSFITAYFPRYIFPRVNLIKKEQTEQKDLSANSHEGTPTPFLI